MFLSEQLLVWDSLYLCVKYRALEPVTSSPPTNFSPLSQGLRIEAWNPLLAPKYREQDSPSATEHRSG